MYYRTTPLVIVILYIYNIITHVNGQSPSSSPTNSPTTPTSSPTFIAPPFAGASGAATITKFEMLVSNQVVASAGSGETVYFDYVPAIGTTVTIRMTFNWDSSSSANLYCPGCIRQLLLGVERSHVNNACYSRGSGGVYTGLTLSVSYTHDDTPRHISTGGLMMYGCDDLINSIPSNKIGFILSTTAAPSIPSIAPTKAPSLPPTKTPTYAQSVYTMNPSFHPSTAPTIDTLNPSISPTEPPTAELCTRENAFCHTQNVYSVEGDTTAFNVDITNSYDGDTEIHDIYFTAWDAPCFYPYVSVSYLSLDHLNGVTVLDDTGKPIAVCQGSKQCAAYTNCVTDYHLATAVIPWRKTYQMTVFGKHLMNECNGINTMDVRIEFVCDVIQTLQPTIAEPTANPLVEIPPTLSWSKMVTDDEVMVTDDEDDGDDGDKKGGASGPTLPDIFNSVFGYWILIGVGASIVAGCCCALIYYHKCKKRVKKDATIIEIQETTAKSTDDTAGAVVSDKKVASSKARCTDCMLVKEGKIYEGDQLFYCFECFSAYEDEAGGGAVEKDNDNLYFDDNDDFTLDTNSSDEDAEGLYVTQVDDEVPVTAGGPGFS